MTNDFFEYKEKLINWELPLENEVSPSSIDKWYLGKVFNKYPDKFELQNEGLDSIAKGWLPDTPIINEHTKVLAIGSCFARNFILWLAEHGFNKQFPNSPYNALLKYGADFESPAVIAQQFRWAFDELSQDSILWIDKNKQIIPVTEEGKKQVREVLENTDILILTLGLSEVWYDNISGEPLWRSLTKDTFNSDRHVFRVETVTKTLEWLECIEYLRQKYLSNLKIIYTLSPIPLKATFRPISAITANSVSKAILRASLDEFLRNHETIINKELFYFPSYEIVTDFFLDAFREDNRHLSAIVPGTIIAYFAKYFCTQTFPARETESLLQIPSGDAQERVLRYASEGEEGAKNRELLARIADLEVDNYELQKNCNERQKVIDELAFVAKERLNLIESLDAQLKVKKL